MTSHLKEHVEIDLARMNFNNAPWFIYTSMILVWSIVTFWILGPETFPDYVHYVGAASYGYQSFFEFVPQYFLVSVDLFDNPKDRVQFYFFLVHVVTVFLFCMITMLSPKASFMQALYYSYYLPFFMTTALRASLAYLIAGVLLPIMLASGRRFLALFCGVIACFFHDSGVYALVVMLLIYVSSYVDLYNYKGHIKKGVTLCFFASVTWTTIILDVELFPDIGRFLDYINGSLNSYPKLLYLYFHIFGIFILLRKCVFDPDLELYFLIGALVISIVALINHVAAIRLLPFIMGAGFLMLGDGLRVAFGRQIFVLIPFMLAYFYFNFAILLRS